MAGSFRLAEVSLFGVRSGAWQGENAQPKQLCSGFALNLAGFDCAGWPLSGHAVGATDVTFVRISIARHVRVSWAHCVRFQTRSRR